jgi:hypothetical protein
VHSCPKAKARHSQCDSAIDNNDVLIHQTKKLGSLSLRKKIGIGSIKIVTMIAPFLQRAPFFASQCERSEAGRYWN